MEFGHPLIDSSRKTYAQAVSGDSPSVNQSWAHLQSQDEKEALILALHNSLEIQVFYNYLCVPNL